MPLEVILDTDALHRRIPPHAFIAKQGRVSSSLYMVNRVPDNEISMNLARLTTHEETLRSRPDFGIGEIIAGVPREIGFEVRHDPIPENDSHSVIEGANSEERCRLLAQATDVVIAPRATTPRSGSGRPAP